MPNPTHILNGTVTSCKIKEISAMYSLSISLCYELQDAYEKKAKDWDAQADRFFAFIMDNFPTELTVMASKVALTTYKLPFDASKLKHFDRFHDKYGKYILVAMES
jgi:hypothetical protein